tara:strand:- start:3155 stop:3829 length:675 start_codon:yes stop_codon:yes gene_type:complete
LKIKMKNIIITFILLFSNIFAEEKIAIATKIIGNAKYIRGNEGESIIKKGQIFENGDIIATSKGGFVALLFIDDKTALKIKESTKLTISGKRAARSIAKEIKLDGGVIRATVNKQKQADFIIRTSVSVASVKGTDFWVISNKSNDSLIGLDGKVEFSNIISGQSLDIISGKTGISSSSGDLQSFKTDPKSIPDDPSDNGKGEQKLEIKFEDASGNKKTLVIKYK